jgi:hypothetical protein
MCKVNERHLPDARCDLTARAGYQPTRNGGNAPAAAAYTDGAKQLIGIAACQLVERYAHE